MWLDVLSGPLAERRTLCAIDLRGHGRSPWAGDPVHTMERFADDVAAVMRSLGDEPADVSGLSMGGYVAFALWQRHRAAVRSLVLTNTRAPADTDAQKQGRDDAIDTVTTKGRAAIADAMLPKVLATASDALQKAQVRTMIESLPVETIVADQRGLQQRADRQALLGEIDVPTLVVAGSEDTIATLPEAEQMAKGIRGARLEVVPETAHLSPLERPQRWAEAVATLWT
jgi:pimeloyl-ACP methyl ester carboxylesterase